MKVHLRMVGCRLNQSEIDSMARQFSALGHEVVDAPAEADHFVLNTCAVTGEAAKKSRKQIRDFHRLNPQAGTTVTGCYAQLSPAALAALPGVARVVDNFGKARLVEAVLGEPIAPYEREPVARAAVPGMLGRTRAFVKVQDGCDNACTFCVTTLARGAGRSRPLAEIAHEINNLSASGYQEAVLTGVHLGSYGYDLGGGQSLMRLVEALLRETDMPRLRLSSLEPWDLAPDFFSLWRDARLCRHLHLPLQSGCDATLKRMRRQTSQRQFRQLLAAARSAIGGLRVTTDVIVGFPGETDAEFAESERFIREMDFGGLHVFRYSQRPGTPAARMKKQVAAADKKSRSARLLAHCQEQERRYAERLCGASRSVLWEQVTGATPQGFINTGYTDDYQRVQTIHPRDLTNIITRTRLNCYTDGLIHGTVKEIEPPANGQAAPMMAQD